MSTLRTWSMTCHAAPSATSLSTITSRFTRKRRSVGAAAGRKLDGGVVLRARAVAHEHTAGRPCGVRAPVQPDRLRRHAVACAGGRHVRFPAGERELVELRFRCDQHAVAVRGGLLQARALRLVSRKLSDDPVGRDDLTGRPVEDDGRRSHGGDVDAVIGPEHLEGSPVGLRRLAVGVGRDREHRGCGRGDGVHGSVMPDSDIGAFAELEQRFLLGAVEAADRLRRNHVQFAVFRIEHDGGLPAHLDVGSGITSPGSTSTSSRHRRPPRWRSADRRAAHRCPAGARRTRGSWPGWSRRADGRDR